MALTLASLKTGVFGDLAYYIGTATFDSAYLKGGEALTAANLGMSNVLALWATAPDGVKAWYDDTNATLALFADQFGPLAAIDGETAITGLVQDDDNAATSGVIVYAVVDVDPGIVGCARGHFEFVGPTNVDGRGEIDATYKQQYLIVDNDLAATDGKAVRAVAAGGGLEATFSTNLVAGPLYIPVDQVGTGHANVDTSGIYFRVNVGTTASTPTVYFDEDAAEESERLMAVMVDNADETFPLYTKYPTAEVKTGTDCSACVVTFLALGSR